MFAITFALLQKKFILVGLTPGFSFIHLHYHNYKLEHINSKAINVFIAFSSIFVAVVGIAFSSLLCGDLSFEYALDNLMKFGIFCLF